MTLINDLRDFSSTSYADVLGVQLGLTRLPGETTTAFLIRLSEAAANKRDHSLPGMLNQIRLQLGLRMTPAMTITSTDPAATVVVNAAGVLLTSTAGAVNFPLLTIDPDNVWSWNRLADIVADINLVSGYTATLLVQDAPALQLAAQSNTFYQLSESISGAYTQLQHSGIVVGTEQFNQTQIPDYQLTADGKLTFSWQPPDNLTISYKYIVWPYDVVCSDVGMISLVDPGFASIAVGPDGTPTQQALEILQAIVKTDLSYWSK